MGRKSKYTKDEVAAAIACGNQREAAKRLGIPESNLRYYIKKYDLDQPQDPDFFMTYGEIAAALGISQYAVKAAEQSAMAKLQNSMLARYSHG